MVAERLRLPGLIGLVLGGLLLGPYALGLLPEGALDAIGGIGLLFLMFMAGAELDLNLFQRYDQHSTQFSQFDPQSIMIYPIPRALTLGGFEVGWNSELSATDKDFIAAAYPKPYRSPGGAPCPIRS